MKQTFEQNIYVQGDLHIEQSAQGKGNAHDGFLGIILGCFAAICAMALLVGFVVHIVELAVAWVAAHAITLAVVGIGTILTTVVVVRKMRRAIAPATTAVAQVQQMATGQRPAMEIETVQYNETSPETPEILHLPAADHSSRGHGGDGQQRLRSRFDQLLIPAKK